MLNYIKSLTFIRLLRLAAGVLFIGAAIHDRHIWVALIGAALIVQGAFNLSCWFIPNQTCAGSPLSQQENNPKDLSKVVFEEIKKSVVLKAIKNRIKHRM